MEAGLGIWMNIKKWCFFVMHIVFSFLYVINKFTPDFIENFLVKSGTKMFLAKARARLSDNSKYAQCTSWVKNKGYLSWIKINEPVEEQLEIQRITRFNYEPKISIVVPTFNTPKAVLIDMVESVIHQTYHNWELCIADASKQNTEVDDVLNTYQLQNKRIIVKFLSENKGIVGNSNEALSVAGGAFVTFLDHDDTLAPFALYEIIKTINAHNDVDFIYSDEDKISEDGLVRFDPHFKQNWSPDTLRSYNYITHLTTIKRKVIDKVGWFRDGYDGSQDYDLILRATEQAKKIVHIPKILYHWRTSQTSVAGNAFAKMYAYESAKKALSEHLFRTNLQGKVEDGALLGTYKINYKIEKGTKISIIIPNKDHAVILRKCIYSILNKSTYNNYEIILVENNSSDKKTFQLYEELEKRDNIKIIHWDKTFNYSIVNNFSLRHTEGDMLLFLNNDTEVISPDWLERMLEFATRKDVGAVGAKLYYPDGTVQHAGVIVGIKNNVGHSHKYLPKRSHGYMGRLQIVQNVSAVTGACLMMRKDVFTEVNGFEENYAISSSDIDLCLKIRGKGYLIVWTPWAELYHYESKTRGHEDTSEKKEILKRDVQLFQQKWKHLLADGDPYYSPNLSIEKEDFSIRI